MADRAHMMLLVVFLGMSSAWIHAQAPASAPSNSLPALLDRAADDAMQNLYDTISSMSVIADNTTRPIATLLSISPQAEQRVRQAVLAHKLIGRPRPISSGVIAVEVSVESPRLIEALQTALADETSNRSQQISIAEATPVVLATGYAAEDGLSRDSRPGWRHCTPEIIDLCRKAAERDLRQRLLGWLLRVPLANGTTVAQLARQDDRINRALRLQIDRIMGSEFSFEPTGVCILTCTVSSEQLTALLRAALTAGELNLAGNLRPAVAFEPAMSVQGFSLIPPQPRIGHAKSGRGPRPAWAGTTLTKTASASAPSEMNNTVTRKELAIRAARIEAKRQLWKELEALPMPDGRSVGVYLSRHADRDSLAFTIDAALLTPYGPGVDDQGTATVTLSLPLETVWHILAR